MSIHKQGEGKRGSLKWIQRLINCRPEIIDREILHSLRLKVNDTIKWVSPLRPDYKEYRDADFLKAIGHPECAAALKAFWPSCISSVMRRWMVHEDDRNGRK